MSKAQPPLATLTTPEGGQCRERVSDSPRVGVGLLVGVAVLAVVMAVGTPVARAAFGLQSGSTGFDASVSPYNGEAEVRAGSHPVAVSVHVGFSGGEPKTLKIDLPPGMIENPRALPRCGQAEFASGCPDASQVGLLAVRRAGGTRHFPLFNLAPAPGYPSELGARPFGAPLVFTPTVRQDGGRYGVSLAATDVTQVVAIEAVDLTVWGTPWASEHDGLRGACLNADDPGAPLGSCPVDTAAQGQLPRAYLTIPNDCAAPLRFAVAADSWQAPGAFATAAVERQTPTECDSLPFSFGAAATPSSAVASSPTGLTMRLTTSQAGLTAPAQRLAAQPRRAVVALAEGITINPSVGAGLGACTPAQYGAESPTSAPGEGCPNPSKIGVGSIETPLVDEVLDGSLFIAKPFDNPFNAAYGLYFVAKAPQRGFVVKVPGRLDADPASGRLVATFEGLPQLPYTNLRLEFREGQRAPLVTPAACGGYDNRIVLQSWTGATPPPEPTRFPIVRGVGGSACPAPGVAAPFAPKAVVGMLNSSAGFYGAFYMHLTRTDAEQEITSYSAQLPPGLLGRIAGVPFCPDAAIEAAKGRSGGEETARPSCPAASEIGHTYSGYGAGLAPAYAPGRLFLAGPYRGAPLSVVAINPAIVGPFDLGTVVVRSAIRVDPRTAQVTIDSTASDPIPHIFSGIPLRLRDIRIYIDRPQFMLNPTNCTPSTIVSTLTGTDVPFTDPRAVSAAASVPFQTSDCIGLKFAPRFSLRLRGGTRRGAYPRLRAVVTPRPGDANIASAVVTLPPSIFLEQGNIRAICTRPQSEADACPGASVIGRAVAQTPLLAEPMEGPVYLRSSSGLLPDLVTALHWQGVRIVLEGRIDSHRGGLRATFHGLPDAPVSRFTMVLFGGRKRGVVVNAEQLCRRPQRLVTRFVGQSNRGVAGKGRIGLACGKRAAAKKHGAAKKRRAAQPAGGGRRR